MKDFQDYEYVIGEGTDDAVTVKITFKDVYETIPRRIKDIYDNEGTKVSPYYGTSYVETALSRVRNDVNGWCLFNFAYEDADTLFLGPEDEDMRRAFAGFEADLATDAYCRALAGGKFGSGEAYDEMLHVSSSVRDSFERHMHDIVFDLLEECR